MEESEFKKIAYNCKKATFLIEKKQIGNISMREKLELKIHLACCSACRIFERQSILILALDSLPNLSKTAVAASSDRQLLDDLEQIKKPQ